MPRTPPWFDEQGFQLAVLGELEKIRAVGGRSGVARGRKRAAKKGTTASEARRKRLEAQRARVQLYFKRAQSLIESDRKLRTMLCAGLATVTEDLTDIAKNVTYILVPLSLAGTVAVPLDPALFAMLAFVIWRAGVSAICTKSSPRRKIDDDA